MVASWRPPTTHAAAARCQEALRVASCTAPGSWLISQLCRALCGEAVNSFDPGSHTQHTQTTNNTDRPNKAEGRNTQEGSRVKRTNPRTGSQTHEFTARVYSQRAAAARRAAWRAASEAWT